MSGLVVFDCVGKYLQTIISARHMPEAHRQIIGKLPALVIGDTGMAHQNNMWGQTVFNHTQPLLCGCLIHCFDQVADNRKVGRLEITQLFLTEWCLQVLQFSIITYLQAHCRRVAGSQNRSGVELTDKWREQAE